MSPSALFNGYRWSSPCRTKTAYHFDAGRSLTALEQGSTIIAVIELSHSKWVLAALVPGVVRHPPKKFDAQVECLLKLLHIVGCNEAGQAGRGIGALSSLYEAGPRRILAGALVAGARCRGLCHPSHERRLRCRANTGVRRPIASTPNS